VKLRCIDDKSLFNGFKVPLIAGKLYEVLEESKNYYRVIDEEGRKLFHKKTRFEIVKENDGMKKSDLKSGMIVEWRDGRKAIVLKDTPFGDFFIGKRHEPMDNYSEDLKHAFKDIDVMKVYKPNEPWQAKSFIKEDSISNMELIYNRKDNSEEVSALKTDITNIENTLKEMKDKLNRLESEA
jgi:hypothetical protein